MTIALNQLKSFLQFPSISTNPDNAKDVSNCADWLMTFLLEMGFVAERHETAGHPVVYAERCPHADKPTILFYGHYDVQPIEPLELWESDPFDPQERDGYLYARGVADDKGQVFCHLWALKTLIDEHGELPVNVKLVIEGEEEVGSPNLMPFLEANKDRLNADVGVVSDTPMFGPGQPSVCLSLRGITYMEFVLRATHADMHSGQQGGATLNPIHAAAQMISQLKDADHKVRIPGFYDRVNDIPDSVRDSVARLAFDEEGYRQELGAPVLVGETGFSTLERRWFRPTLDCNGIVGGFTGEGAKTVIPAEARVKLSMRLVADQDPEEIEALAKQYLAAIKPDGVDLSFIPHHGGNAYQIDPSHPGVKAAQDALKITYNTEVALQGEGGSIPILSDMQRLLEVDFVLMGLNLPNDNIHAPNERFSLECFEKGISAAQSFYQNLA